MAKTKPPTDPGAFKEAVDWFRVRVPIQKEKWLELTDTARRKASTIAGVAQVDIIGDVMKDLEHALTKGETLEDFRKRAIDKLTEAWGGKEIPGRIETIFRTNVQMAHSHGRREQMVTPSMLKIRPYWRFVSLLDMRTTQFCRPLNGTTLPATDVFWNRHTPPLHFNCRSMLMSLRSSIAEEEGITEKPPKVEAMEGFGGVDPLSFKPDLTKYPKDLAKAYKQKEKEQPPPKPKEPEGPTFSGPAGAQYAKEFPKLAALYGQQLWVGDTPQARLHLRDLEKIPEKLHLAAKNAGIKIAIGPGTLNDFKAHSPEASGLIAHVNKQKRNAKQTGGIYSPTIRLAITGDGQYDKFGTFHSNFGSFVVIHEFGHAYDLTAAQGYPGVTSSHDFIQLWRKMADTTSHVRPYFLQDDIYGGSKGGGWTVGAAETYAESFALYFGHGGGKKGRDEVAKTFTPEIADWMHGHLQNAEKKK